MSLPAARTILVIATAVAVLTGVGVGGYHWLSGDAPAPRPVPAVRVADDVFAAAPAPATDGHTQQINDVAAAGRVVVAAGAETGSASARPRFLVSTDGGRQWRVGDVSAEAGVSPVGPTPQTIVAAAGGWLALSAPGPDSTAWTSQDGRSWRRLRDPIDAFESGDEIRRMARAGQTSAAIGTSAGGDPVLWLSADARRWERLDGELKLPLGNRKESVRTLRYLAAAGSTLLLAGDVDTGKSARAGAWRSTDGGRTWSAADVPTDDDAFGVLHVAGGGTAFFALRKGKGSGDERKGVVFESADGDSWRVRGEIPLPDGRSQEFSDFTAGGQGLATMVSGGDGGSTLFHSADRGGTWRQSGVLPRETGRTVNGMAVADGSATVVGGLRRGSGQDFYLAVTGGTGDLREVDLARVPDAVTTERSVNDLAVADGRAVAVGSTNADAAVWTSADGASWRRSDTSALAGDGTQVLTAVAKGSSGWLAIGRDQSGPLVAASPDGNAWRRIDDPAFEAGDTPPVLNAVTGGPKGYVVVGADGDSAAAWVSSDLGAWKRGDGGLTGSGDDTPALADVAGTTGGYVAVGRVGAPAPADALTETGRPEVWTSADGLEWEARRPGLPDGATVGGLTEVAVRGTAVVAAGVGTFSGYRALALSSDDSGLTWQAARLPLDVTGKPSYVSAITATGAGFAVAGSLSGSADGDVLLWTSADGRTWRVLAPREAELAGPGSQRLTGLAGIGGRVVGVGFTAGPRTQHVTLWRGPAA